MRMFPAFLLLSVAACAPQADVDADALGPVFPWGDMAAVPGALHMEGTDVVVGYRARLSISGASPRQQIFLGASLTGADPVGFCPPQISDCLNLRGPVFLLGSGQAAGDGTLTIDTPPIPANLVGRSLFLQAASASGTSEVVHRFIDTTSACGAGVGPIDCVEDVQVSAGWNCAAGVSCQDVYDVYLQAGQPLDIATSDITGASVVRLAVFAPGVPLTGINELTQTTADSECTGQNVDADASFVASVAGRYRVAIGRDWGSSAGATGTYSLALTSDAPLGSFGQTVNDAATGLPTSQCGISRIVSAGWTCAAGVSCQDVYDISLPAGAELDVTVDQVTGASVPRVAVFAPGTGLASTNLFTGQLRDRECVGQNQTDALATWLAPSAGTWRIAVGRDWGSSAGGSGTYRLTVRSQDAIGLLVATVNDGASAFGASTQCPFTYTTSQSWSCPTGLTCEDTFAVNALSGADVSVDVTAITGASVARLSMRAPGVPRTGTNLFNGLTRDQECAGQNADATAGPVTTASTGPYQVSVGRDWGSSAGASGTYTVTISAENGFPTVSQTGNDTDASSITSGCP